MVGGGETITWKSSDPSSSLRGLMKDPVDKADYISYLMPALHRRKAQHPTLITGSQTQYGSFLWTVLLPVSPMGPWNGMEPSKCHLDPVGHWNPKTQPFLVPSNLPPNATLFESLGGTYTKPFPSTDLQIFNFFETGARKTTGQVIPLISIWWG